MQREYAVFKASEAVKWKESGIPKEWEPSWNLMGYTGGGSDGSLSPVITPLLVPESVVLSIMPLGCARHGDLHRFIEPEYESRLWYLRIDEKEVVTGEHIIATEKALEEIMERHNPKPKIIFLVSSCMDILLGTDYESVARRMEKKLDVRIGITLMPPLINGKVLVENRTTWQAMHGCLRRQSDKVLEKTINLIGRKRVLPESSEFITVLKAAGVKKINHIARFMTIEEADKMCQAELNIAIEPDALPTAKMMERRWGIPYVYVENSFYPDEIQRNYQKIGQALGIVVDDTQIREKVEIRIEEALEHCKEKRIVIGENTDRSSFKAALDFLRLGFCVSGVFNKIYSKEDYEYLEQIVQIDPNVNIYISAHPSMYYYVENPDEYDFAIGVGDNLYKANARTKGIEMDERYPEYQELLNVLDKMLEKEEQGNQEEVEKFKQTHKVIKRWGVFGEYEKVK